MDIENWCPTTPQSLVYLALELVSEPGFIRDNVAKSLSRSFVLDHLSAIGLALTLVMKC